MNDLDRKLTPFRRRVRLMSAWKGLAAGACVGATLDLGLAVLDWNRVLYTDWQTLAMVVASTMLLGVALGFFRKVDGHDLAASLDRRGGLKDRLATALEPAAQGTAFDTVQHEDAERSLSDLRPAHLFPVRFGRWQLVAGASMVLAASVFLLGNSPALRGPKTASERKELKEIGHKVQRVAKPVERAAKVAEAPQGTKRLAGDLNRFAKELENGRLNKEEAMRKANDLASKAEDEAKARAEEAQKKTEEAETSLGKFHRMKLDEAGVDSEDLARLDLSPQEQAALEQVMSEQGFKSEPSRFSENELKESGISRTAEKLAQLSPEQREQLRQAVANRQAELQREIDRLDKLPAGERAKLEQQRNELLRQQQEMQKLAESLQLSEETLKALKELMDSEEMKKLQETLRKMQEKSQQMNNQGQPMSKEELEQLKQQLDELARMMKDPQLKEQVLKQLQDALKQLESGQMSAETMQQMLTAFGMQAGSQATGADGNPMPGSDDQFADTGKVVKSEKEMETKGKTSATRVSGTWDERKGEQWSVTVKAPTQVGNRSSVPYQNVMPQYKKSAEKALSSGKIPREKERRVKEYFESLSGGR